MKYPNCKICRRLREVLPEDEVPDEVINAYHESKGSYELFPKKWQDTVIDVMLEFEIAVNRRCKCPRCGSRRIDQAIYDRAIEGEWYHCADCGAWYNEYGELDEEGEYN